MELWPIHLLMTYISTPSAMEWEADSERRETFEAVTEGMYTTPLRYTRLFPGIVENALCCVYRHGFVFVSAKKQPSPGLIGSPIIPQDLKALFRQHGIPIFAAFALFNPYHHLIGFNMFRSEFHHFAKSKAGTVNRGQQCSMF